MLVAGFRARVRAGTDVTLCERERGLKPATTHSAARLGIRLGLLGAVHHVIVCKKHVLINALSRVVFFSTRCRPVIDVFLQESYDRRTAIPAQSGCTCLAQRVCPFDSNVIGGYMEANQILRVGQ